VEGNKCVVDADTDYLKFKEGSKTELVNTCDLDTVIKAQGEFNKLVFGCKANNEVLPFPSDSFDSYIAGMSLMLVANHRN